MPETLIKTAKRTRAERDAAAIAAASIRWLTPQQAADYVGCSVRQIQIVTREGKLQASYALGERSPRYDRSSIDAWMAGESTESTETPRLTAG
jgi:excisionase family DNA binding protein